MRTNRSSWGRLESAAPRRGSVNAGGFIVKVLSL